MAICFFENKQTNNNNKEMIMIMIVITTDENVVCCTSKNFYVNALIMSIKLHKSTFKCNSYGTFKGVLHSKISIFCALTSKLSAILVPNDSRCDNIFVFRIPVSNMPLSISNTKNPINTRYLI